MRNEPKTLQDWYDSEARVVVGCFPRSSGKTTTLIEKARHARSVLIITSGGKKITEKLLREGNVDGDVCVVSANEETKGMCGRSFDLILLDDPDYFPSDEWMHTAMVMLSDPNVPNCQLMAIGTVKNLDCSTKLTIVPADDFDANPRVIPIPESRLLYLGLRCADAEMICVAPFTEEENMKKVMEDGLRGRRVETTIPVGAVNRNNTMYTTRTIDKAFPSPGTLSFVDDNGISVEIGQVTNVTFNVENDVRPFYDRPGIANPRHLVRGRREITGTISFVTSQTDGIAKITEHLNPGTPTNRQFWTVSGDTWDGDLVNIAFEDSRTTTRERAEQENRLTELKDEIQSVVRGFVGGEVTEANIRMMRSQIRDVIMRSWPEAEFDFDVDPNSGVANVTLIPPASVGSIATVVQNMNGDRR